MPIVDITLIEGRSPEAKVKLMEKVTAAIVESIGAPPDSVRIILRELPASHFAVAGVAKGKADPGSGRS
jgi:4-oxalocrotonate tautomerase